MYKLKMFVLFFKVCYDNFFLFFFIFIRYYIRKMIDIFVIIGIRFLLFIGSRFRSGYRKVSNIVEVDEIFFRFYNFI